jgi:hypothetical protein
LLSNIGGTTISKVGRMKKSIKTGISVGYAVGKVRLVKSQQACNENEK